MKSLEKIFEEKEQSSLEDVERYKKYDFDLCMLCDARGADKRNLFISCFYDIKEVLPEAIDLLYVDKLKKRSYFLLICKNCRGEFLDMLGQWRNAMCNKKDLAKDHDGHLLTAEEVIGEANVKETFGKEDR